MFEKLKNLIKNNKGFLIKTTILLGMYFFLSDFAFASQVNPGDLDDKTKTKIVDVIMRISTIISVFLGLLTYLVTLFLSPEWITGSVFGLGDKLKAIWVLISNVVYFSFAFILIYIAFMNIVGAGGNDYEFKSAIPKFIVGILIVPFSWFLVNFMVTLSSILTIAALNLPFDTFQDYRTKIEKVRIPKSCTIKLNALSSSNGNIDDKESKTNNIFDCETEKEDAYIELSKLIKTDKSADGIFGIISTYNYGIVNLESVTKLNKDSLTETIKTIGDVVVKVAFDLIFVIAYGLLMIALGLALMIRGIWLWIYMMLSPLFGLMYFFGKGKEGFFENFNFTEFLHLCMVPVYTMLALSFGMLFIFTTGDSIGKGGLGEISGITISSNEISVGEGNDKSILKIEGAVPGEGVFKDIIGTTGSTAFGAIGSLILKIFGIVILWGSVMMALSKSKITEAMIKPIADFGSSVGNLAKSIPQYTPILPGGQSLQSLNTATNTLISDFQSKMGAERGRKLADSITGRNSVEISNIDDLKRANETTKNKDDKELNGNIMKFITSNFESNKGDKLYRDEVIKYATKQGLKEEEIKKINFTNAEDFRKTFIQPLQQRINNGTLYSIETAQNWNGGALSVYTGTATPPKVQDTTEATNIANSSQKTVNTNQVNGTDNNGQVNQGGNNGQNTQTPPTNGNGNP